MAITHDKRRYRAVRHKQKVKKNQFLLQKDVFDKTTVSGGLGYGLFMFRTRFVCLFSFILSVFFFWVLTCVFLMSIFPVFAFFYPNFIEI